MFYAASTYSLELTHETLGARRAEADRQRLLALSPPSSGRMARFAGALRTLLTRHAPAPVMAGRPGPTATVCCPGSAV